jgi:hypothetical protein
MEAAITKQHGDKKDFKLELVGEKGDKTAYFHVSWTGAKTGKTKHRYICFTNRHREDGAYYQRRTAEDIEDVCQGEDDRYPCETLEDMWN